MFICPDVFFFLKFVGLIFFYFLNFIFDINIFKNFNLKKKKRCDCNIGYSFFSFESVLKTCIT